MRNDVQTSPPGQTNGLSTAKQALLAKWLRGGAANKGNAPEKSIPRRPSGTIAPLSVEQQRLWFFNQLDPDSPLYNMPIASRLRGPLNPQALQQAMDTVVARHEALRTRFIGQETKPFIDKASPVPMHFIDLRQFPATKHENIPDTLLKPATQDASQRVNTFPLSHRMGEGRGEGAGIISQREAEARRLLEAESKRAFDLSRDLMVRAVLVQMADDDWIFLVLMHHIASDDWSWRVFCSEVAAAYESIISNRAPDLPAPLLQYGDFAVWQKEWLAGNVLEQHLAYWRKQLDGAPPILELPTDRPRPAAQTFHGACEWLSFPSDLSDKINTLSQSGGFTPFMILLTAFQTLLHRYTGQEDIVVGSPVAGRGRACLDKVIGLFVNMLVLRTKLDGNPAFFELLHRTQASVLEALAHQELPFEKLVEELQPERSASYSPLIQVMFALQDELSDNLKLPGLAITPFTLDPGTAKFDLTFTIVKSGSSFKCCAEYNSDLFDSITVRQMLGHYQNLLESVTANSDQTLADIPLLLSDEQNRLLIEWNNTAADYPRGKTIHELFAAQVAATPNAVAVVFGNESLTYQELDWRANQLAHHLKFSGAKPETLVAISMDRSLEMIIGLLGTLKAGAAYLPLDPGFPAERLHFMLDDSKATLLLTR